MPRYEELYDLLLDYANLAIDVERVMVGVNWTLCEAGAPGFSRTLSDVAKPAAHESAPLKGRTLAELSLWLRKWNSRSASIGLAAVNAAINREADMVYKEGALFKGREALPSSFDWFSPRLQGKSIVVVGDRGSVQALDAQGKGLPIHLSSAVTPKAEQLLPRSDWVFLPAQSIADKTLPRLLELSAEATCVLYGAEVPWLEEWADFGVDYLVGSQVDSYTLLQTLIAEGVGDAAMAAALSFRVIACDSSDAQCGTSSARSLKLA